MDFVRALVPVHGYHFSDSSWRLAIEKGPHRTMAPVPGSLVIHDYRDAAGRCVALDRMRIVHAYRERFFHHHGNLTGGARLHDPGVAVGASEYSYRPRFGLVEHRAQIRKRQAAGQVEFLRILLKQG